ncbi:glycosyltransferase family 9 protein [Marinilabilia rubra]|uniref:Glycosyltransferase family 9 protein n=2 Tax=Marinilabilia rubra TaxID=2162893 RepID=A0A2U2B8Z1_9BACT|nr:glycosyltransferase family 9 protein [Marinilabilia rubra]
MTVPLLWSLRQKYPDSEIWFVSRPFAKDLVEAVQGVHFLPVDLKVKHKGLPGLIRLFKELNQLGPWDAVIDLHSVLRTHVLTSLFKLSGTKVSKIDKGRKEKKALTRKNKKDFRRLLSTQERYRQVFTNAGYPFDMVEFPGKELYGQVTYSKNTGDSSPPLGDSGGPLIGIAPFAKHQWKMWPEEKMKELMQMLEKAGFQIYLFGGPGEEQEKLEEWASKLKNARTFAGQLSMAQELKLISTLSVMVSMDSANMHFASLAGTRVVSIWGATHPYAGFYGFGQSTDDAVQIELPCRPCSVFGNKPCHRGDFACMMGITPKMVFNKIVKK